MLVFAAIGVFGAGMLAIAAGIPIKDFGYGNTLILSGVMAWCTSALMLTLWACFRDLKKAAPRAEKSPSEEAPSTFRPSQPALPTMPPGWPEAIPERAPAAAPPSGPAPAPAPPPGAPREPRRNLLFTSTRRPKDAAPARETGVHSEPAAPPPVVDAARPAAEEARPPVLRRPDTLPPRTLRPTTPLAPRDPAPPPPAAPLPPPAPPPAVADGTPATPSAIVPREPERPARADGGNVSVLKSGVVDGMAYWLYSDGSIEAQMPEGMMRFSSIDELRAHLDKRP